MADDPDDITAWQRLDRRTTTSGRLLEGDISRLAEIGVRHVINLAMAGQPGALDGEAELLAANGLRYTHIEVPFDAPEERHFREFCAAYEADEEPVHVHCIANLRVAAFFYRYNREVRGMDEIQARALMERQWSPETTDNPAGPAWARFISRRED